MEYQRIGTVRIINSDVPCFAAIGQSLKNFRTIIVESSYRATMALEPFEV